MKNLKKLFFATAAFCAVPAASFAEINDWDDTFSSPTQKSAPAASNRAESEFGVGRADASAVPADADRSRENNFNISVFYAMAADEYISGASDTKIDTFGLMLQAGREFRSPGATVGLDFGVMTAYAFGSASDIEGTGIDADQFDVMVNVYLGPRFGNTEDGASFGIGVFGGFDFRRLTLEYSGSELDDTALGFMGGVYADLQVRLSDNCALSVAYHYALTSTDCFEDELDGALEKEIGYHMFSVGLTFFW